MDKLKAIYKQNNGIYPYITTFLEGVWSMCLLQTNNEHLKKTV